MLNRRPAGPAALAVVLALVSLAVAVPPARGATASLLADINPGMADFPDAGGPRELLPLGGRVLFVTTGGAGFEVWVSDGTALGTFALGEVCPEGGCDEPDLLAASETIAFFAAGDRLWATDGTPAGTVDVGPAPQLDGSLGQSFALAGSTLFFRACDPDTCGLWKSDGTVAGTDLLESFAGNFPPQAITAVGSTAFFLVGTDSGNLELWRSDGTAAGTVALRSFREPTQLTAAGGRLFFFAEDAADPKGAELWTSDGTAAGTRALTHFAAPAPFGSPRFLAALGSAVYFVAEDVTGGADLWTSDGTPGGTRRVTDFGFAQPFDAAFGPRQLAKVGGRLLFVATDGLSGDRLWTSDGTPRGTAPLAGCPGGCPAVELASTDSIELVPVAGGNRVIFIGFDPAHGEEPWSSNGTAAGTQRLRDVCPGPVSSSPRDFEAARGQGFFIASACDAGATLWRTDGTVAGTRRLTAPGAFSQPIEGFRAVAAGRKYFFVGFDRVHGPQLWVSNGTVAGSGQVTLLGGSGASSLPMHLAAVGGRVVFSACDGEEHGLWASDGTAGGTLMLPGIAVDCPAGFTRAIASAGSLAFFVHDRFATRQLWRTDGTPAGTVRLTGPEVEPTGVAVPFAGHYVFPAESGGVLSLWTTDGTPAGTARAFDLPASIRDVRFLTSLGGRLYFVASASDAEFRANLWASDGTAAGTVQLTDLGFFAFEAPPELTLAGGKVFFVAGERLWRTDGTRAGTVAADAAGREPFGLAALGGAVLFFARTGEGDAMGLWRSDGTNATLLAPLAPAPRPEELPADPTPAADAAVLGGRLFFAASDGGVGGHGLELWASDGTAAGTVLVRDIAPGAASSSPAFLTAAGGRLYFAAGDRTHGRELWQSDGTAAGTRLVQDIAPGAASSAPRELTAAGGRLFFTADDGLHGREPWVLPLEAGPPCQASATTLCLNAGRFRVEVFWRDFQGRTGPGRAVALTPDTGYFWFFNPANVEVVVKVLDARDVNGHFWVFYGALTNVEYVLTVTDTQTGAARRYVNLSGRFASVGDTDAFGPRGATGSGLSLAPAPEAAAAVALPLATAGSAITAVPCVASPTRLCLNGGRFAVEARWRDFQGRTGVGMAVPVTGDTGYFWFFNPANVEVMAKVLDARELNGKFWFFYGALSNVEYTLTVTDTQTNVTKEYPNPSGRFASVGDTDAF